MLDLSSLAKALAALEAVLAKSEDRTFMDGLDDVGRNAVRAGVIQHFEFTYELCWKLIKRWVEVNTSPAIADGVTRRELFRLAAENRLLSEVERWMGYHHARNLVSHTYVPAVAAQVYAATAGFARDAAQLLAALEARND